MGLRVEHFEIEYSKVKKRPFPPTPSFYLWDSRLTLTASVIGHHSEQTSLQKSLYY